MAAHVQLDNPQRIRSAGMTIVKVPVFRCMSFRRPAIIESSAIFLVWTGLVELNLYISVNFFFAAYAVL